MTWWTRRTQKVNGRFTRPAGGYNTPLTTCGHIYRPSGKTINDQPLLPIWGILAAMATAVAVILATSGCSFSCTVGTGNRATTTAAHSQIPETLHEVAPIVGEAAKGAVVGAKGGL